MQHAVSLEWLIVNQRALRPGSPTAYLLAATLVGAATLIHLALGPWLTDTLFALVLPAVTVTSILCGGRAGLLAIALSAVSVVSFIEAPGTLHRHVFVLGLFILVGSSIVTIVAALRSSLLHAKRVNAELLANEGRLAGLMEAAPDAMIIESPDRHISQINHQAESLFGYRRDELVGQSVEKLIPEKDRAVSAARHKGFLIHPGSLVTGANFELVLLRKDGREIPVEATVNPIPTEEGTFVCIAVRDLTQRKETEEALRVSEKRYRTLSALLIDAFDASDDGIVLYDSEDRVVLANKKIKQSPEGQAGLFTPGRTFEEILRVYWSGSDFAKDTDAFERYVAAEVERHQRGDGSRMQVHVGKEIWLVNRDFRTRDGSVLHIATDVSSLVLAKEAAEQANLSKSRFLAAASHDLRQPLQTISLLQGFLRRSLPDAKSQAVIDKLEASADSMSDILNSMLELQQLESGVVTPNLEDFVVGDFLERICAELRLHAEMKGLDLRHVRSGVVIRSDPKLLEQIIRNLLSNAIKYTQRGKILIGCRHTGQTLRIEVLDTGIGIARDQIKAIFEEFRQINNPTRDRSKGLGLGLSITQRLANLLDHPIDIHSILHKGTVLSVAVPLGGRAVSTPRRASQPPPAGEKMNILLVEDDLAVRWSLQALLELVGHKVIAAENGDTALARLAEADWRPDLIVCDFNLPGGMNGLETVAKARKQLRASLPAVLLTGDVSLAPDRVLSTPNCVLLKKPADATAIIAAARSLVSS